MNGIIIPPGVIKQTVDKTAQHVAKNGSEFQKALIEMQQNKPEFAFLRKDNPYRAYYDHLVAQYSRKLIAELDEQNNKQQSKHNQYKQQQVKQQVAKIQKEVDQNDQQEKFLQKVFEQVKEPDPDKYSVQLPQKLTKADMAMIQHTAQYVAINGKNFLIALSQRQKNNPQFQFLRSSSQNHEYFTKIVAAYNFILEMGPQQTKKLQQYTNSKQQILNKCKKAYEYFLLKQERGKNNKQETDNKKQSNIDWNDFQLVQTIIFDDFKPKKGYSEQFKMNKPLFQNRNLQQKIISEPKKKQLLQLCHICKRNILATQMTKHLKTCLTISGNNANSNKSNAVSNFDSQFVNVSQNLQSMSQKRPDIFGGQSQSIRKNQQQQVQKQEQKVIWDGQAPNMSRTTASIAMMQNQQKKIRQQMNNNNK